MSQFVQIIEHGDSSVHCLNVRQIVQVVQVPGAPVATVFMADGKNFRITSAEAAALMEQLTGAREERG